MAVLFDQKQRQAVARLEGMSMPVSIFSPVVRPRYADKTMVQDYLQPLLEQCAFALPLDEAIKRLNERCAYLQGGYMVRHVREENDEPKSAERIVKKRPNRKPKGESHDDRPQSSV